MSRLDAILLATLALLMGGTFAVLAAPELAFAMVAPELDLAINTAATLAAGGVAALAWSRFVEGRQVAALFQSSAFLVLAVLNALLLFAVLFGLGDEIGLSRSDPTQLPMYASTAGRLTAASLLAFGGVAGLRRLSLTPAVSRWVLLVPAAGLLAGAFALLPLQHSLPSLTGDEFLRGLSDERLFGSVLATAGPGLMALQGLIAIGYLSAAILYVRLHRRDGQVSSAYLAIGLVVAAFAQVHFAFHPGAYQGLITTGDLLRVAFYGILLAGVDAERRADLRALRRANEEVHRLHRAELTQTALEERARLAREVHDGLAQDLWYAKLKQGRLVQTEPLASEARQLADEVADAIDSALAEARQVVMALRASPEGATFVEVLHRYLDDFGDRFGVPVRFEADGDFSSIEPRVQAEVLRIAQEALNNVRKHADATLIRVHAAATDGLVRLSVIDNGRGFDPAAVAPDRYGLDSMRERAGLVGGRLVIDSIAQGGTSVMVEVPPGGAGNHR